jgi:hypothetical protein
VSTYDTVVVSLEGGPLGVTLSVQDDTICRGESTLLTAYGYGGNFDHYSYKWIYNGQLVKEEQGAISTYLAEPPVSGDHEYTVEIDDQFNIYTALIGLHVAQSPVFIISGGPTFIACPFDLVTLKPNMTYPGATYYWSNGAVTPEIQIGSTGIGFESRMYALEVENGVGCGHSDSVMVIFDFSACTGIDDATELDGYRVFPNPSEGAFNIELDDVKGFESIIVYAMNGKVIYEENINRFNAGPGSIVVDLSLQPGGIYFMRLIHEDFIRHHKLIVK